MTTTTSRPSNPLRMAVITEAFAAQMGCNRRLFPGPHCRGANERRELRASFGCDEGVR